MTYVHGAWNAICDRCGFRYKNTQLRKEWTGLRVCSGADTNDCYEVRHPQEFVRGKADKKTPPWVRPEAEEIDVSPGSGNEVSADDL
jgi:hypothetical protein